jgi:integrase
MADLVVVLVETGLRLSEALNLRWEDIDMTASHIRVWQNKSDKPRSVPLSTAAWNVLCPRSEQGAGPFVMMSLHSVRHRWDAMKKRLGLQDDKELTPHCCRHTFASWLVQRGVPIFTVKELCGHKCIEVTMRYAHLKDEDRTNAITAVFG